MDQIVNMIISKMSNVNKPQRDFMSQLFIGFATFVGKATFRNLSRYSGLHEKTISRWFRKAFDYLRFNELLLSSFLSSETEKIAVVDASYMSKSGKKTEGLGSFWDGKASKSHKGLEISLVSVIDLVTNTGYSLEARQTVDSTDKERTRIDFYSEQVVHYAPTLKRFNILYVAVDCLYAKAKFITPVCKAGLHLIGKMRRDADLKWQCTDEYSGRGRPKKFDGKVDINNDLDRFEYVGKTEDDLQIYTANIHAVNLEMELRIVILKPQDSTKYALLYSTDTQLDAKKIVQYYRARFQIEFIFRDAKQYLGLIDCQSTKGKAIHNHVNTALTTLNLIKIEDRQHSIIEEEKIISIASWKRRYFNLRYMKILFAKLDLDLKSKKILLVFQQCRNYGVIES